MGSGGVEQRILRRAIDKGLITEEDLAPPAGTTAPDHGRWGPRIERLLDEGRLDEIAVAALAEELAIGQSTVESAPTIDAAPGPSIDPDVLRGWDRYQIVAPVGAGGGGEVFRARDARLDRDVAIKFLHADRADLVARFRREAQAQARIEHEHVCKVFEVGEVGGRSFIAMQYIDGETFTSAARKMTVEARVRVVAQVAEAVHAAHRLGLVHRDLKPGNVMIERDPDGAWKPWVVDFGLAREMERAGTTTTIAAVGTPAFMAPEQARGASAEIDRRTDVYGLGATLFAVLAGRPPFLGATVDVLMQVVSQEAPALRSVVPALPADLATIAAKCLDRDPARRYDSARALAEDLTRFLDGEPILARPMPWRERMVRRVRRHRAMFAVSALAVVALAIVGTLWVRSALGAREAARLAQRFGQDAQAIENLMRVAHLMPAHDIRPERDQVRARMKALEQAMADGGDAAEGPGHYALGRGALALGDLAAARKHLETAWQSGYQTPEVAYALGQVLGEQYEAEMQADASIEAPEVRDARRRDAARDLRDPALVYLRAGRGAESEAPTMIEGLIAFREGRFDDALARLAEAQRAAPSLYEARRLAGDIYTDMAHARDEAGDPDGATALATKAADAYRDAAEIGRSDAAVQVGDCERRFELVVMDSDRGRALDRTADDALAACERALVIDPDSVDAYREEAVILWRVGEAEANQGKDPRPTLARAAAEAEQGLRRDPRDVRALIALGTAWLSRGDHYEAPLGIDPRASLGHAIDAFERAIAIRPSAYALNDLGATHSAIADWAAAHGEDPRLEWDKAADGYRRAIGLAPTYSDAYLNLGNVFGSQADYELNRGLDPRPSVDQEIATEKKAIELKPTNYRAWSNVGGAWSDRAEWERDEGIDCRPSVDERLRAYRKVIELKPDYIYAYDNMANAWHLLGLQALDRGLDPSEFVQEGRSILAAGRKLDGNDPYNYHFTARLELLAARFALHGPDAAARFADADAAIAHAIAIDPGYADSFVVAAEIQRWRAEGRVLRREPTTAEVARGLDAAARALKINATLPTALAVRGALLLLQGDPESRSEGLASLRHALELDPLLARDYPPP